MLSGLNNNQKCNWSPGWEPFLYLSPGPCTEKASFRAYRSRVILTKLPNACSFPVILSSLFILLFRFYFPIFLAMKNSTLCYTRHAVTGVANLSPSSGVRRLFLCSPCIMSAVYIHTSICNPILTLQGKAQLTDDGCDVIVWNSIDEA